MSHDLTAGGKSNSLLLDGFDRLGIEAHKVALGGFDNHALPQRLAANVKSVVLSSGKNPLRELGDAMHGLRIWRVPVTVMLG